MVVGRCVGVVEGPRKEEAAELDDHDMVDDHTHQKEDNYHMIIHDPLDHYAPYCHTPPPEEYILSKMNSDPHNNHLQGI